MIPELRAHFNRSFTAGRYAFLLDWLEEHSGVKVEFRVAETPIFVPRTLLEEMGKAGAELAGDLLGRPAYLDAARKAIPSDYRVAAETVHPNFLTADFALVRDAKGDLVPRLVEIQAFPSVYGYQAVLAGGYHKVYGLYPGLGSVGNLSGGIERDQLLGTAVPDGAGRPRSGKRGADRGRPAPPEDPARLRSHGAKGWESRWWISPRSSPLGDKLHYRNRRAG